MSSVCLPYIRHHIWLTFLVMTRSYRFTLSFLITLSQNTGSFQWHCAGCSKSTSRLSVSFTVKPLLSLSSVFLTVVFICVKLTEHVTNEITQKAHKWILTCVSASMTFILALCVAQEEKVFLRSLNIINKADRYLPNPPVHVFVRYTVHRQKCIPPHFLRIDADHLSDTSPSRLFPVRR